MTAATYETLSASDHGTQLRRAIVASTIGTTIEWYDFFLYGTAAGLIFGKFYFPNSPWLFSLRSCSRLSHTTCNMGPKPRL